MERNQRFIIYSILALLYAVAIFILSSIPTISLPAHYYDLPNPDKLAHTALFFGFGILLCLSFHSVSNPETSERAILYSFIIGITYGVLDEVHQHFVPGRYASLIDVGFNSLGIIIAIVIFWLYDKWRKTKSTTKNQ